MDKNTETQGYIAIVNNIIVCYNTKSVYNVFNYVIKVGKEVIP